LHLVLTTDRMQVRQTAPAYPDCSPGNNWSVAGPGDALCQMAINLSGEAVLCRVTAAVVEREYDGGLAPIRCWAPVGCG
jgi:hypothetical protein